MTLTGLLPYDERWCSHRTLLHRSLNVRDVNRHKNIQVQEVHKLIQRLAQNPDNFLEYVKRWASIISNAKDAADSSFYIVSRVMYIIPEALSTYQGIMGSIIMLIAYGKQLKAKDKYVEAMDAWETVVQQMFEQGFLVDLLPTCLFRFVGTDLLVSDLSLF